VRPGSKRILDDAMFEFFRKEVCLGILFVLLVRLSNLSRDTFPSSAMKLSSSLR
jgi:hypothetical protein